jgi:putative alpha-1,2-mannosidase
MFSISSHECLIFWVFNAVVCTAQVAANPPGFDPLDYVNQLIGSNNGGNVFAGASLPYGMAKAVADVSGEVNIATFDLDITDLTIF